MSLGKTNENRSLQEFILVSPAPAETAVKMSRNYRYVYYCNLESDTHNKLLTKKLYYHYFYTTFTANHLFDPDLHGEENRRSYNHPWSLTVLNNFPTVEKKTVAIKVVESHDCTLHQCCNARS